MRYFKAKTTSYTKKGTGYHLFWSRNIDTARRKMARMKLPVFDLVELPMKESCDEPELVSEELEE